MRAISGCESSPLVAVEELHQARRLRAGFLAVDEGHRAQREEAHHAAVHDHVLEVAVELGEAEEPVAVAVEAAEAVARAVEAVDGIRGLEQVEVPVTVAVACGEQLAAVLDVVAARGHLAPRVRGCGPWRLGLLGLERSAEGGCGQYGEKSRRDVGVRVHPRLMDRHRVGTNCNPCGRDLQRSGGA